MKAEKKFITKYLDTIIELSNETGMSKQEVRTMLDISLSHQNPKFINFDKEDFIGNEALMKSDRKCKTWGMRVIDGTAITGESIKINERNIGRITSRTWSP